MDSKGDRLSRDDGLLNGAAEQLAARLAALRRSAGGWKDRDFTGEEYVESMRGDLNDRLRRLGFD